MGPGGRSPGGSQQRIVEKAAEARANDKARKKLAKENEREKRMVELAMLRLGSVCFLFF